MSRYGCHRDEAASGWEAKSAIVFLLPSIAETCRYFGMPFLGSTFDLKALTPANAMQRTVLPHITASVFTNDDASPWAGHINVPAMPASGKPLPAASSYPERREIRRFHATSI